MRLPCYAPPMMSAILTLLLACATESTPSVALAAPPEPTVRECPAGTTIAPLAPRADWSLVLATVGEPGAEVVPWLQVLPDRVVVQCPPEGGTLRIEWGD